MADCLYKENTKCIKLPIENVCQTCRIRFVTTDTQFATINRETLINVMLEECSFGDKNVQRKAGGRLSTQELLSVYLVLKGIIKFGNKDKTMKFRETLKAAERLASGKIEGQQPCVETGCQYRNPNCENGEANYMEGLCNLIPKKHRNNDKCQGSMDL
jgi:hypothetical protein